MANMPIQPCQIRESPSRSRLASNFKKVGPWVALGAFVLLLFSMLLLQHVVRTPELPCRCVRCLRLITAWPDEPLGLAGLSRFSELGE